MIRTLDDLAAFTEEDARRWPDLADEILLRPPGCSEEEIAALRAVLPGLPPIYLHCLSRFDLRQFDIGYFSFAPLSYSRGSMLDRLTEANAPDNPYVDLMTERRLIEVGSYGGDPICVSSLTSEVPDEVYLLKLPCPSEPTLHRTARNFEQLMIGTGRLADLRSQGLRGQDPIERAVESLSDFDLDQEQLQMWRFFAEGALEE